jgi:hypothetical protein
MSNYDNRTLVAGGDTAFIATEPFDAPNRSYLGPAENRTIAYVSGYVASPLDPRTRLGGLGDNWL